MLLHQLQRVLVARFEVVVLSGADLISGHRAHGVDDICEHTRISRQTGAPRFERGYKMTMMMMASKQQLASSEGQKGHDEQRLSETKLSFSKGNRTLDGKSITSVF